MSINLSLKKRIYRFILKDYIKGLKVKSLIKLLILFKD